MLLTTETHILKTGSSTLRKSINTGPETDKEMTEEKEDDPRQMKVRGHFMASWMSDVISRSVQWHRPVVAFDSAAAQRTDGCHQTSQPFLQLQISAGSPSVQFSCHCNRG